MHVVIMDGSGSRCSVPIVLNLLFPIEKGEMIKSKTPVLDFGLNLILRIWIQKCLDVLFLSKATLTNYVTCSHSQEYSRK